MMTMQSYCNDPSEVGIDEAGRGSIFGPVMIAGVIWNESYDAIPGSEYIRDSKTLSPTKRLEMYRWIKQHVKHYSIFAVDNTYVDEYNILECVYMGINAIVDEMKPSSIVIDGSNWKSAKIPGVDTITSIVKGDSKYKSIAAASILAKVTHDKAILKLLKNHTELEKYDLHSNMGYGTKKHYEALRTHGPTEWHRLTFKGVVNEQGHPS